MKYRTFPKKQRGSLWAILLLGYALFLFAPELHAEPSQGAALSWVRDQNAAACPAGPAVAAEVERLLNGRALVSVGKADIVVEGRISRVGTTFETTLTLVKRDGTPLGGRTLSSEGEDCGNVLSVVGLAIALMIDPDAALRLPFPVASSEPENHGAPPVLPPAKSTDPGPNSSAPRLSPVVLPGAPALTGTPPTVAPHSPLNGSALLSPPPTRVQISLGPVFSLGVLPNVGVGARLRAVVLPPRFIPIEVGGDIYAPSRLAQSGLGLEMWMAQGRLRACPFHRTATKGVLAPGNPSFSTGSFGLMACAGFDLGAVESGGFGFPLNRSSELFWGAFALSGHAKLYLTNILVLSLGLDLAIPVVRGRYSYVSSEGRRELFFTSPLSGSADVSFGIEL